MKYIALLLMFTIIGCSTVDRYHSRLAEIEAAYVTKQITTAEYLSLKTQLDMGKSIKYIAVKSSQSR